MFHNPEFGLGGGSPAFGAGYAPAVALDPDTILSPADVARAWGLSPAAVRNMIAKGELPADEDDRGNYQIEARELGRRPVVEDVEPVAGLGKVPSDAVVRLHELHNSYVDLANARDEALKARDRYIASLANEYRYGQAELDELAKDERYDADDIAKLAKVRKYSPTDIGRQLPGEGAAEHMSRSTVNRLAEKYRGE